MGETSWLSRLLILGAVLEVPVGLGLLAAPSATASLLLGAPLDGAGMLVARLAGGGLLALGLACWFARATPSAPANAGVASALLVYNIAACVVLAVSRPAPTPAPLQLAAAGLHAVVSVALLIVLLAPRGARRS